MRFDVITLFPDFVRSVVEHGVVGRAEKSGLIDVHCWNPRDFTEDVHRTVDDRPFGGGPGMIFKPDCVVETIRAVKQESAAKVVYLSPQGKPLNQAMLDSWSKESGLTLLCGRYEGIDERIIELEVDEECSLGDYVISGGELGAMVMIDALTRLLPNALGHENSAIEDSFVAGRLDYPHYTRPEQFEGMSVPSVLLSGNHQAIARWRQQQALLRTMARRPDLIEQMPLDDDEKTLLSLMSSDE